jgi:Ion channel
VSESAVEKDLEERGLVDVEGDGLYERYLLALGLLIATIITFAWSGDSELGRLVAVAIEGLTLLVILRSSRVHPRILVAAASLVALCLIAAIVATGGDRDVGTGGPAVVGALLAILGPPAIIRRLLAHHRIDLTTVAGALCVYLLAGIFFAYVYGAMGDWFEEPFFAQDVSATGVDYVYFSFVTLATLGYGDLTARSDLGRMLSATEAIMGQLYLVSAVALLVGNLGHERVARRRP